MTVEALTPIETMGSEGAPHTADVVRAFAQLEGLIRQLARRLRAGEALTPDEADLLALFVEFHAHYPAATLEAFAGQLVKH